MRKPQKPPTGEVAGYIRKSDVAFTADMTVDDRKELVERLTRTRMGELVDDAKRDGLTITRWYVDMAVSGQGKFLSRRLDMLRAKEDAKQGEIAILYARDLSRIFRSVVQFGIFTEEMEALGVDLRAGDIPRSHDRSANRFQTNVLASVAQYKAEQTGEAIYKHNRQLVLNGDWVGRSRDMLGLTYGAAECPKGFVADHSTAAGARLIFETLISNHGNYLATAKAINAMVEAGHPDACLTVNALPWSDIAVKRFVASPIYRRVASYGDVERPAPHLIPEVIPEAVIARLDALLEARKPSTGQNRGKRIGTTYSGRLFCGECGYSLMAVVRHSESGLSITYNCHSSEGKGNHRECSQGLSVDIGRVDRAVNRAIAQALQEIGERWAEPSHRPRQRMALSVEGRRAQLEEKRSRIVKAYINGAIRSEADMQAQIAEIDAAEASLKAEAEQPSPPHPTITRDAWQAAKAIFDTLSSADEPERVHDRRLKMLEALGIRVSVIVAERTFRQDRKRTNIRRQGGIATYTVEIATLGYTGAKAIVTTETRAELSRCRSAAQSRRWQHSRDSR